ncbi:MAG TPA: DUF3352 domain-containing protein, partial [Solirubrobacteraceae bacterium]|nr:DUF3352 domain-containing protein [Solirubrobacteraceae bacterium]
MSFLPSPPRTVGLLGAAAIAVGLSGCGSQPAGGLGPDPASLVPGSAALYVEAVLRPDGQLRADFDAGARKLLATADPASRLSGLLQAALGTHGLSYQRDVKPWLGPRAGLFAEAASDGTASASASASARGLGGATSAVVVDVTDGPRARRVLDRALRARPGSRITVESYGGVPLELDSARHRALAVVGPFAVIGSDTAVRAALDSRRGHPLSRSAPFQRARSALTVHGLLTVYADSSAIARLVATAAPRSTLTALAPLVAGPRTTAVTLGLDAHALRLETVTLGPAPSGSSSSSALSSLPADSWLALGASGWGARLRQGLVLMRSLSQTRATGPSSRPAVSGLSGRLLGGVTSGANAALLRDLGEWGQDLAVFARGSSLLDTNGAIVITSSQPARVRAWVARLRSRLAHLPTVRLGPLTARGVDLGFTARSRTLPVGVDVAAAGSRLVLALGSSALAEALRPTRRFSASAGYAAILGTLGGGLNPSFYLDPRPLLTALDALGLGTASPGYAHVHPYLQQIGPVQAG